MKAKKKKTKVILPLLGRYGIHYAIGLVMLFTVDYVNLYIPEFIGNVIDGLESFTLDLNGIVAGTDGKWIHFDYVPGEPDVRHGSAGVIGRLCVIGSGIQKSALAALFGVEKK